MNSWNLKPNIALSVEQYEVAYIQVDNIVGDITIFGRVYPNSEWQKISIIDPNYNFIEKITNKGVYIVDTNGFLEITIQCDEKTKAYISYAK
mgnify:CR=1 FL=1